MKNLVKHFCGMDAAVIDQKGSLRSKLQCTKSARMRILYTIALVAVIGFTFTACSGGGGNGTDTAPAITTEALPSGTVGTEYSQTLEATGDAPITWSVESGDLPGGLTLSVAGVISGTPEAEGTSTFTVKATNAKGNDTKELSITIAPTGSPTVTTASLPSGTVGTAYSRTLEATGDAPITWSKESGSLPGGLTLSGAGVISGTPTAAGTFTFTVKAANAAGNGTKPLSITIASTGGGGGGGTGTAPTITTTSLPNGEVGTAYNRTLAATGDTPITWSIEGTLPGGLTLNATTGAITGTPTTANTFNFTVKATNAKGNGTKMLSIIIAPHTTHIPNTETGLCTVCNALTYNLGDTGPGGGKIFYRLEAGFTVYQNATDTTGVTCHYLEAAPADRPGIYMWASSAFIPPPNGTGAYVEISGTGEAIGTGRKNTALILATDANAPAAKACNDYSNGGKTDWFLPSKDELNRLYVNRTSVGNMGTAWYWSSSQSIYSIAWLQGFSSGDQGTNNKHGTNTVRAVRAF